MKSLFFCFFSLFSLNCIIAQQISCKKIYIWQFENKSGEKDSFAEGLTEEVEDVFSQLQSCSVLQRRKYASHMQQIENEISISTLKGIPSNLKSKLNTIEAERVVFGVVDMDFSFNANLRLRIENLQTSQINTVSILIDSGNMTNPQKRRTLLKNKISEFLNISPPIQPKPEINKRVLENILSDDCENIRSKASTSIDLYLSTNCTYRILNYNKEGNIYQISVRSIGKIWDEHFMARYEIDTPNSYRLISISR